jgi:hypothetical protein
LRTKPHERLVLPKSIVQNGTLWKLWSESRIRM